MTLLRLVSRGCIAFLAISTSLFCSTELPHLEKRGAATQLIVDGSPYLIRGGELTNTATSDPAYLEEAWPRLSRMQLNTVLAAVAWDWIEPEEGHFDFHLVDAMIASARKNNLRLVVIWFGSWKNSVSSFAPAWVKADAKRFPRARIAGGKPLEMLSTFGAESLKADLKAYTALLRHLREVDGPRHTVLMLQLENEVGMLGGSRDLCAEGETEFAKPVPPELLKLLQSHRETLSPALRALWDSAGAKAAGTWQELFGLSAATDEIFMAWHYARYLDQLAEAGKAEYRLPVFTNTWIVQPEDRKPGDYPSGGPEPLVLDIWKAGAPSIDFNAPDIYLPNFADWVAAFHRPDNPLFVPESFGNAAGAANAFYAVGRHAALGYSPFGIDLLRHIGVPTELSSRPGFDPASLPISKAYAVLAELSPLILKAQASGSISAVQVSSEKPAQDISLGDHVLHVALRTNRRNPDLSAKSGYALVIAEGPASYLVAGQDVFVTFSTLGDGGEIVGLARVEAGGYESGQWTPHRRLNGDDVLINYDLATAAAANQSGSGLIFDGDAPTIQRATLYHYR